MRKGAATEITAINTPTKKDEKDESSAMSGEKSGGGGQNQNVLTGTPHQIDPDVDQCDEREMPDEADFPEDDDLGMEIWNQAAQVSTLSPLSLHTHRRIFADHCHTRDFLSARKGVQTMELLAKYITIFLLLFLVVGSLISAKTMWSRILLGTLIIIITPFSKRILHYIHRDLKAYMTEIEDEFPLLKCELTLSPHMMQKYSPKEILQLLGSQMFFPRWRQDFEWVGRNTMRIRDAAKNFTYTRVQLKVKGRPAYGIVFQATESSQVQGREVFLYEDNQIIFLCGLQNLNVSHLQHRCMDLQRFWEFLESEEVMDYLRFTSFV